MLSPNPLTPLQTPNTRSRRKRERERERDQLRSDHSDPQGHQTLPQIGSTSKSRLLQSCSSSNHMPNSLELSALSSSPTEGESSCEQDEIAVTWKQDDQIKALLISSGCNIPLPSPTQKPKLPISRTSRSSNSKSPPISSSSHPRKRPCRPHRSLPSHATTPVPQGLSSNTHIITSVLHTATSPNRACLNQIPSTAGASDTCTVGSLNTLLHRMDSSSLSTAKSLGKTGSSSFSTTIPSSITTTSCASTSSLALSKSNSISTSAASASSISSGKGSNNDDDAGKRLDALLGEFAKTYLTPVSSKPPRTEGGADNNARSSSSVKVVSRGTNGHRAKTIRSRSTTTSTVTANLGRSDTTNGILREQMQRAINQPTSDAIQTPSCTVNSIDSKLINSTVHAQSYAHVHSHLHLSAPIPSPIQKTNPSPTKAPRIGLRSTGSIESTVHSVSNQSSNHKRGSTRAPFKPPLLAHPPIRSSPRRQCTLMATGTSTSEATITTATPAVAPIGHSVRAIGLGSSETSTLTHESPLASKPCNGSRIGSSLNPITTSFPKTSGVTGTNTNVEKAVEMVGGDEDGDDSGDASFDSFDGILEGGGPDIELLLRTIDGGTV